MKKTTLILFLFTLLGAMATTAWPQTPTAEFPYALDPLLDGGLLAGGLALYGGSLYFDSVKSAPSKSEVDPGSIPFFDRAYPAKPSAALSSFGNYFAIGLAALPVITVPGRSGAELATVGLMYAETLELAYSMDSILKSIVVRYRPYAYSTLVPANFSDSDITASFPSSHATLAFSAAVFTGVVFDHLYPDSNLRTLVWAGGLGLAAAASSFRVLSADHFVSDVVAGAAIGAASGFLVPYLHERARRATAAGPTASYGLDLAPAGAGFVATLRY